MLLMYMTGTNAKIINDWDAFEVVLPLIFAKTSRGKSRTVVT